MTDDDIEDPPEASSEVPASVKALPEISSSREWSLKAALCDAAPGSRLSCPT